jgi:hypothetical protein
LLLEQPPLQPNDFFSLTIPHFGVCDHAHKGFLMVW